MKFLPVPRLSSLSSLLSTVELIDSVVHCRVEAYSCKVAGKDKKVVKEVGRVMKEREKEKEKEREKEKEKEKENLKEKEGESEGEGQNTNDNSVIPTSTSPSLPSSSSSSSFPSLPPILIPTSSVSSAATSSSPFSSSSVSHPTPLGPMDLSTTRRLFVSLITTLNASFPDYDFTNIKVDQFERETSVSSAMSNINMTFVDSLSHVDGYHRIKDELWGCINETVELENCEIYIFSPDDDEFNEGKLWTLNYFFYNKKAKKILFLSAFAETKMSFKSSQSTNYNNNNLYSPHFDSNREEDNENDIPYDEYEEYGNGNGEEEGGEGEGEGDSIASMDGNIIRMGIQNQNNKSSNGGDGRSSLSLSHSNSQSHSAPHSPSLLSSTHIDSHSHSLSHSHSHMSDAQNNPLESDDHHIHSHGRPMNVPSHPNILELDWDENDANPYDNESNEEGTGSGNENNNNQNESKSSSSSVIPSSSSSSSSSSSLKRTKASTEKIHTRHPDRKSSKVEEKGKESGKGKKFHSSANANAMQDEK